MYPDLAAIFQRHGYALAVHGSLARDFDLIAVAWAVEVSEPSAVLDAVIEKFAVTVSPDSPAVRNHGRKAYTLICGFGNCQMDVSFLPRFNGPSWQCDLGNGEWEQPRFIDGPKRCAKNGWFDGSPQVAEIGGRLVQSAEAFPLLRRERIPGRVRPCPKPCLAYRSGDSNRSPKTAAQRPASDAPHAGQGVAGCPWGGGIAAHEGFYSRPGKICSRKSPGSHFLDNLVAQGFRRSMDDKTNPIQENAAHSFCNATPLKRYTLIVDHFLPDGGRHLESISAVWSSHDGQILSHQEACAEIERLRHYPYDGRTEYGQDWSAASRLENHFHRYSIPHAKAEFLPTDHHFGKLQELSRKLSDGQSRQRLGGLD